VSSWNGSAEISPVKAWPLLRRKAHFQVADAGGLQPLQQVRADARDTPDIQRSSGFTDHVFGLQAHLVLKRFVDLQQAAVGHSCDHQNVWALLEHRGKFLLGQLQRLFRALGVTDVDHQASEHRFMAVFDQADNVAYPQATAVGGDHPVIDAVITVGAGFAVAIGFGARQVGGVNDAAPEAWNQPMGAGVTEQFFGMRRHVTVGEIANAGFPGDGGQALHQAAIVIFAAAQFLLGGRRGGKFPN